ncbi:MAG: hypothetical protein JXA87_02450 [Thermoleophilia bacterium]|nr:hypothetical protein [Thermoleophilia bacterium]
MGDDRTRILDLLAAGKITAEEAARLLDALDATTAQAAGTAGDEAAGEAGATEAAGAKVGGKQGWPKFFSGPGVKTTQRAGASGTPKFMYVKVLSVKGDNVNVKIPLAVMRAGLKLTSLIPAQAQDQINKSMAEHGMSFDLTNFKPEDLDELIDALREMEIDVDSANGDKVHVYAE